MSKKKKKLKKMAESNIKILKSGKIKLEKGQKIDLSPFVNESIKNSVVSRLDGIISKEDVVIETADCRVDITTNLTTEMKTAELAARVNSPKTSTIVIVIPKKDALDCFNFVDSSTIGTVLRTSTFASIYKELKPQWVSLNEEDTTAFTNVMYVPNVMVFVDLDTGKIRKHPFNINVLIVAVPSASKMIENSMEKISDEDASARIIADISDAGIRCGAKDLILDPFSHKILRKDPHETAKLWNQITSTQRFIEQYNSVVFTVEEEDMFVIFNAQKMKPSDIL